ncbi:hypothetical protein STXM2123_5990 [Streptomyces sp. F-3]|nr:hypothetical protein STXM2123_5990 [Streptomyces sp. F-3]
MDEDWRVTSLHIVRVQAVDAQVVGDTGRRVCLDCDDLGRATIGVLECVASLEVASLSPGVTADLVELGRKILASASRS